MNRLCSVIAVLAVSTAQADTIFVDANCPGGDGSELEVLSRELGKPIEYVNLPTCDVGG